MKVSPGLKQSTKFTRNLKLLNISELTRTHGFALPFQTAGREKPGAGTLAKRLADLERHTNTGCQMGKAKDRKMTCEVEVLGQGKEGTKRLNLFSGSRRVAVARLRV